MAAYPSPRSPRMHQAMLSPVEYLPVTRFPTSADERHHDQIHEAVIEMQKERDVILSQPYRTTQLILPGAKTRPDLINNKLSGKPLKPTVYRPLDEKSVLATLDENRALVNRQMNSPKALYSKQNLNEAVYVQTGVNLAPPIGPGEFNPQTSPTFRALLEEEAYGRPAQLLPAPHIQQAPPQKHHVTTPSNRLNSIGQPAMKIAQSDSFRRLMINVLGE